MLKNKTLASSLASFLMAATLLFTSCVPETVSPDADLPKGAIRLVADNFKSTNGSKLGLDDNGENVFFIEGDVIWLNGKECVVSMTPSNTPYISVPDNVTPPYVAIYPADIAPASYSGGTSVSITLPHTQVFRTTPDGRQNVEAPLCAYLNPDNSENPNALIFQHITAAITLALINPMDGDIQVTGVTLKTGGGTNNRLNGSLSIDVSSDPLVVAPAVPQGTENEISVTFEDDCIIPARANGNDGHVFLQIPILPVDIELNKDRYFQVKVTAKPSIEGVVPFSYVYERKQAPALNNSGQHPQLEIKRGELAYAPVEFDPTSEYLLVNGLFTIDNQGTQVFFSKGNLKYQFADNLLRTTPDPQDAYESSSNWSFFETQDAMSEQYGSAEKTWSISSSQKNFYRIFDEYNDGNISLFVYGATGKNGVTPRLLPLMGEIAPNVDYPTDLSVADQTDWGCRVEGDWFTLSADEWKYLLGIGTDDKRQLTDEGGTNKPSYATMTVNGVNGIVIYPDNYWKSNESRNTWEEMQNHGAVFLPATGRIFARIQAQSKTFDNGSSFYWTRTGEQYLKVSSSTGIPEILNGYTVSGSAKKRNAAAVRLVRKVTAGSTSK
ncbi:MAG: hypothetical protein SPL12_00605 [Bacteroidales bacterium]|nr:hypothetical protein [Bacteroidales bacterium]MDY6370784.1 hypothetical protein [Bacteroidales bacterium]